VRFLAGGGADAPEVFLCRFGAHRRFVRAVREAAREMSDGTRPASPPDPSPAAEAGDGAATPSLTVDSLVAIDGAGAITVYSGKVDLGTGVRTALTQIVAEELRVGVDQIRYVQGDTARTPGDQGYTAGSKTLQNHGPQLRLAAATAFQTLLDLAADALGVPREALRAEGGRIGVGPALDRAVPYGRLVAGRRLRLKIAPPDPRVSVREPGGYRVVGRSVPRLDLPGKVMARFTYLHDLTVPGMLHGRVVRPAGRNAAFESFATASLEAVRAIPGFLRVVQRGSFVGVVAATEWAAIRAASALTVHWNAGPPLADQAALPEVLQDPAHIYQTNVEVDTGDVDAALAGAARTVEGSYFTPYQMHGSMGPSCGVADVRGTPDAEGIQATVWSATQGVYPLRRAVAQLLGLDAERVRVVYMEGSGCYGHNGADDGADDAAADAALLSQAVGQPVRVQWMREEEHGWEPLGPAMLHRMHGGLDAAGAVAAWHHTVFTPPHSTRPPANAPNPAGQSEGVPRDAVGHLLAGQAIGALPSPLPDAPRNSGTRNAPIGYTFPNVRLTANHVRYFAPRGDNPSAPSAPLTYTLPRPSALRSLGGFSNSFANESFVDELAAAAGTDPLLFRLRALDDPRATAVLEAVAEAAGWGRPMPPGPDGMSSGRGVAFLRYETAGAYVAACAEVLVDSITGVVRVTRVVVAHDCGLVVNPDGVRNQIEGNVIQGISRTLKEEVVFDRAGVTSVYWTARPGYQPYPVIGFADVPEIQIVLLDRPTEKAWGAGEPAIGAMPGAIGNAVYAATGVRLRTLPLTPERVRAALAGASPP
jgi:CO/xanthine dehydrogenase Mo-binding subunit